MWRARSDGDDQPSSGREPRTAEGSRPEGRRGLSEWPEASSDRDDPRSELTGKKIRRIDTGAAGPSASPTERRRDRLGSSQALASRPPSSRGDETEIGGPPPGRPGRHIGRPPSLTDRVPADAGTGPGGLGDLGGLGGLPPLRQPTGEQPVVPSPPSALDAGPDRAGPAESVPATAPTAPLDTPSIPDANSEIGATSLVDLTPPPAAPAVDDEVAPSDRTGSLDFPAPKGSGPHKTSADAGPTVEVGSSTDVRPADRVPSTEPAAADVPEAGPASSKSETVRAELAAMPSVFDIGPDAVRPPGPEAADASTEEPSTASLRSAFPESEDPPSTPAADQGDSSPNAAFPSWSGSMADKQRTDDTTRTMGAVPRERAAAGRPGGPGGRRPAAAERPGFDGSASLGQRGPSRNTSQRLQETEIKLAGRQERRPKPQEPNRVMLGLALVLVVLAGAAAAWWLTRDDGVATEGDEAAATDGATTDTSDTSVASTDTVPQAPVADDPILDVPELSLVGVEPGPLDPNVTYSIDLVGEAPGALLQVVVDGVPQGDTGPVLPDLILPSGRHSLSVTVTNGAEIKTSSPVEVYVLGPPPEAGNIANLASIDMINEGWAEALRRFDGFRDAGHQNLQLLPITPGYWNIFVAGVGDTAAVNAYCESFGLPMPDQCFAKSFDPATYTGPVAAAPAATTDTTVAATDTTVANGGTMTDPSGGGTSSTTTGG